MKNDRPKVAVVMGSQSDYQTMREATELFASFSVPCEERILSAHRTPERLRNYAKEADDNDIEMIIAGAGGAAHLPGMLAAETSIPILGVPISNSKLGGIDSFLSIAQMPRGVPVATFSVDGAKNAALFAISVLARKDKTLKQSLREYREKQTASVPIVPVEIPTSPAEVVDSSNGSTNKKNGGGFDKLLISALLLYLGYNLLTSNKQPTDTLPKELLPNELSAEEEQKITSALRQAKDIYSQPEA